jgi:RNA polymerase sigma-70 factor (ECF subfamily)
MEPVLVNGDLGMLVRGTYRNGRPLLSVAMLAVADGRVTAIYNQLNPAKLRSVDDL